MNQLSETDLKEATEQAQANAANIYGINPNTIDDRNIYQNGFIDAIIWTKIDKAKPESIARTNGIRQIPKEVIDFMKSIGNLHSDGYLNLPHWFKETDVEGIYEIFYGRELTGGIQRFKDKCTNSQE